MPNYKFEMSCVFFIFHVFIDKFNLGKTNRNKSKINFLQPYLVTLASQKCLTKSMAQKVKSKKSKSYKHQTLPIL